MTERKLSVLIEAFTPRRSNTLRGFLTVTIPDLRLQIADLSVHESHGTRWVGMPAKPILDRDGTARRNDNGKITYSPILTFTDKATRDAFSSRVIAALLEFAPSAFNDEEAAA